VVVTWGLAMIRTPESGRSSSGLLESKLDAALIAVVAVAAVLRFWRLGAQGLWFDEWSTVEAASHSLSHLFHYVADREAIPPPYFLVMLGWIRVLGDGEAAIRMVSALAGIATVPVAYASARELSRRRTVAVFAALLVAVNPMLVWYSQEARPYSLLAFLGALSMLAFARAWKRGRPVDFVLWTLASTAAVLVHYFAAFVIAAEAVALLALSRDQWRRVLLACVPTALTLAALVPIAVTQRSHAANQQWITGFPLRYRLTEAGQSALVGPNPPDGRLWWAPAGVVALALAIAALRGGRDERRAALVSGAIGAAAVLIPLAAVVFGVDAILSRYLIASLVPLIIAVAAGLGASRAGLIGAAGVAVLCAVSVVTLISVATEPDLQKPDWRGVAAEFDRSRADRVLVLNVGGDLASPLTHYYLPGSRALGDDESIPVEEIDVLVGTSIRQPCNFLVGRACAMIFLGARLQQPIARQFALTSRRDVAQFHFDRYRANRRLAVTKRQLVASWEMAGSLVVVPGRHS
jgi:uncharacterized membrane protein